SSFGRRACAIVLLDKLYICSASAYDRHMLDQLNPAQRRAVEAEAPLLVIAGAGSGKTNTLAHRVAHLLMKGADGRRVLLLTFTRRAAQEMTTRARRIIECGTFMTQSIAHSARTRAELPWSGTFHAVANRLLRLHADEVGLDPSFTVL